MSSNSRFLCPMLWVFAFSRSLAASLNAGDSDLDEAIRKHRMGTLVVQACRRGGSCGGTACGEFWFGRHWPARCSADGRATMMRPGTSECFWKTSTPPLPRTRVVDAAGEPQSGAVSERL